MRNIDKIKYGLCDYIKENYHNEYDEQLIFTIMDYTSSYELDKSDIIYLSSLGYTVDDIIGEEYYI